MIKDNTDEHRIFEGRRPNGQFQKGRSGNPKGRPRKSRSTDAIFQAMLQSKVPMRTGDKTVMISVVEAIAERVKREALTGSLRGLEKGVAVAQKYSLTDPVTQNAPHDLSKLTDDELDDLERILEKLEGKDPPQSANNFETDYFPSIEASDHED